MFLDTIQKKLAQQYRLAKPVRDALKKQNMHIAPEPRIEESAIIEVSKVSKIKERTIAIALPESVHVRIAKYLESTPTSLSKREWVTHALRDVLTQIGY